MRIRQPARGRGIVLRRHTASATLVILTVAALVMLALAPLPFQRGSQSVAATPPPTAPYIAATCPALANAPPLKSYPAALLTIIPTSVSLAAYAIATGALRWRISLPPTRNQPIIERYHDLFIASYAGCLFAISANDGAIRWSHPLHYLHEAQFDYLPGIHWLIADAQALLNEDLPTAQGSYSATISALDLETGRPLWSRTLGSGSAQALVADAAHLYIGDFIGQTNQAVLYALDAATGAIIWTEQRSDHAPVFPQPGGAIVLGLAYDQTYAWNVDDGALRWTAPRALRARAATDAVGRPLIALTNPGTLTMLDANNGDALWRQPFTGSAEELTVLGHDTLLMRTDYHNRVSMFDLRSGTILWQEDNFYASAGTLATPLDTLFVDDARSLIALDVRTGEPRWRIALPPAPEDVFWFCRQNDPTSADPYLVCFADAQAVHYQALYDLRQRRLLWLVTANNPPN